MCDNNLIIDEKVKGVKGEGWRGYDITPGG